MNMILYADDQILMAISEDDLQTMTHHLNLIARKYKMTISSTKTKSMAMWRNHIQRVNIVISVLQASACNTDITPTQPHRNSNTHRTKNNTTNVVLQQNSRKLLMMDILMSETCWAHKKWNKTANRHWVGLLFFNYHNDARSINLLTPELFF